MEWNFGSTNIWSEILVQQMYGVKFWFNKYLEQNFVQPNIKF